MVSSPICDEEENSDLDSSCSTLSVDESENSPPQSQVTPVMLKRTTSTGFTPSVVAVDQRVNVEDPRDWDVQRVKVWAKALFNDEGIARIFEEEEIEGRTLQSERILSDASMDNLGLSTIGKKDKFATAVQDLFGRRKSLLLLGLSGLMINPPLGLETVQKIQRSSKRQRSSWLKMNLTHSPEQA